MNPGPGDSDPEKSDPEKSDTGKSDTGKSDTGDSRDISEIVADAVLSLPGVAGLHGGMFGEAATYLPGRRVSGIRLTEHGTEVHVTLALGHPIRDTAESVRAAVEPLCPGPVHVTVEDVVRP